jgi:hypothetical protein
MREAGRHPCLQRLNLLKYSLQAELRYRNRKIVFSRANTKFGKYFSFSSLHVNEASFDLINAFHENPKYIVT